VGDSDAVAAEAPAPERSVGVEEFKRALGRFASGVTVVTAVDPDRPGGDVAMTATAFVSVSLEPPLVLVSVGEGSRMYDLLTRQDLWAASILGEDQAHVSSRFAIRGRVSDRLLFEDLPRHRGRATGSVILDGALSAVECRTVSRVPAGDHLLVVGLVVGVEHPAEHARPLLYFAGRYRRLRERSEGGR
jgi:flavin reductase (DIM6/NTAB) family NADH-FMN oxidoreductase RutF